MVLRRVIFIQALCTATYILIICKMSVAKSIAGFVSMPLTREEQEKLCVNFTVGNPEKKEFYSPSYPKNYPSDITCIKQITADFGHVVQLDFRDVFELEDSNNCENDRLEVRDGAYGYSTLLNEYCGRGFPNLITSSDRYLWLRFISDDSIEHIGFRAVYEFIPVKVMQRPHIEECVFLRGGHSGKIKKSEIDFSRYLYAQEHDAPIDCTWIITAEPKRNIYIIFENYSLKAPNECDKNYIEIYPERRIESDREHRFCGTSAEPIKSKTHKVHIRLFMHSSVFNDTEFALHYTVIRELESKKESCNPQTEFDCNDNTCIDISLKCDKSFDCKYHGDEDKVTTCLDTSGEQSMLTSKHMVIILVVFFGLVIAMCTSISMSCYNKVQERKAREREYKARKSKEASVEASTDRAIRPRSSPDRGRDASVGSITSKRAVPNMTRPQYDADDDDDESSDGCYVPQVDLSAFQKHPNGGGPYIPRGPEGRSVSRGGGIQSDIGKQYPFISHSTDSIDSDTVIAPAPPPVPMHLKDRRNEPVQQQPSYAAAPYRFVGGKAVPRSEKTPPSDRKFKPVIPNKPEPENRGTLRNRWPPEEKRQPTSTTAPPGPQMNLGPSRGTPADSRTMTAAPTRGPLEAGVQRGGFSRNPNEYGLPKFGTARPSPEAARGPLASRGTDKVIPLSIFKPPENYGNTAYRPANTYRDYKGGVLPDEKTAKPHQFRAHAKIESSDRDSSRADSMESTQSAPDVIAQR